jgi:hypothetical protein
MQIPVTIRQAHQRPSGDPYRWRSYIARRAVSPIFLVGKQTIDGAQWHPHAITADAVGQ